MATHSIEGDDRVYTDDELIKLLSTIGDNWQSRLRRRLWVTPRRRIRGALSAPRRWYQRARYGYSNEDVWEMHHYLAKVALRMTVDMQAHMHGHPADMTEQEWFDKLCVMERGWYAAIAISEGEDDDGRLSADDHDREMRYFRRGMAEFTDRFFHLWD